MLGAVLWLTACTGLFDDIYDDPADQPLPTPEVETDSTETTISGTLYIDASDWEQWYYVDLQALAERLLEPPEEREVDTEPDERLIEEDPRVVVWEEDDRDAAEDPPERRDWATASGAAIITKVMSIAAKVLIILFMAL